MGRQRGGVAMRGGNCDSAADRTGLNVEVQREAAYRPHVEVVILGGVALRWLWKGDAVGAVVEFLENTRVGSRASAEMARARVDEERDGVEIPGQESEEDGPGPP